MIILASQSPYRKSLMSKTGYSFKSVSPLVDEEALKKSFNGQLKDLIQFLAYKKAESLTSTYPSGVIIGSDQALIFEKKLVGKGHSFEGSKKQLRAMSEKKVELITSVTILQSKKRIDFYNSTWLQFKRLSDSLIDWYLNEDKPFDCAGSFKIESSGAVLFDYIECSDPTAVQGLPLMRLTKELEGLSIER